jgi:hypothetical protein
MDREKLFEPQLPSLPAFSQQAREEPSTTFKTVVRPEAQDETIDWTADVVRLSVGKQTTLTFSEPSPGIIYAVSEPEFMGSMPIRQDVEVASVEDAAVWAKVNEMLAHRAAGMTGAFVSAYRFPQLVMRPELSLWTDDSDTVIAYSATDAVRVWEDHMGCEYDGDELNPALCWRAVHKKLDDDFELWLDDSCSEKKKKTVGEWIAEHGRGWFCTTEF